MNNKISESNVVLVFNDWHNSPIVLFAGKQKDCVQWKEKYSDFCERVGVYVGKPYKFENAEKAIFWRDFQNGDLYRVTGWKPEQDSVRMGVDYHAASVEPVGHDGCIHTVVEPMSDYFRFENGEEIHL